MTDHTHQLDRRWVVKTLLMERRELLVVTGPGAPAYDTFAAGDDLQNFYLWGALGSSPMVGLGLALAQPDHSVLAITGDGDMLMGMGALATIGVQQPPNLSLVILDNERYGETGMQLSHTAHNVDLCAIARGCGFPLARQITEEAEVTEFAPLIHDGRGPLIADIKVKDDALPRALPPREGAYLKSRFRNKVLGEAP